MGRGRLVLQASPIMSTPFYHVFLCPVFLNHPWRSDFFRPDKKWGFLAQHNIWRNALIKKINNVLDQEKPLSQVTRIFILQSCDRLDDYILYLKSHPQGVSYLGLSPESKIWVKCQLGYRMFAGEGRNKLWQAFLLCILMDRIFWAHGIFLHGGSLLPSSPSSSTPMLLQYRHPCTQFDGIKSKDQDSVIKRCEKAANSFLSNKEQGPPSSVIFPSQEEPAFRTQLTFVAGTMHQATSQTYAVSSNLFWTATIAFLLSQVCYFFIVFLPSLIQTLRSASTRNSLPEGFANPHVSY